MRRDVEGMRGVYGGIGSGEIGSNYANTYVPCR